MNDLKLPARVAAAWQRAQAWPLWPARERLAALRRPTRQQWAWGLAALPMLALLYVLVLIPFTPGIRDIRKARLEQPAQILSQDGKEIAVFKRSNRDWVALDQISPSVIKALIATEDHRFYQHHGLDWRRTASSLVYTLGGDRQGGSTITQQLARNLYPAEIGRAPTLTRKLKEAITAFKIEALYTKDEILETYLNTVPFLYNAYGIEMAARTYFDKSAKQLSVLESATLVGMLKGTSYYNPVLNPERSLARRNTVLSQMVKREELDAATFAQLKKRPLRIAFERQEQPAGPAPHFALQLRKWLIAWADRNDYNIYTDGLVVHTTLDAQLQAWANQAVARHGRTLQGIADAGWNQRSGWNADNPLVQALVRESDEYRKSALAPEQALQALLKDKAFMRRLRTQKTRPEAGLLAMDPSTGAVRAWVGSRDFAIDGFDHVQQARRQPGSTFKPFVYGAALQQGLHAQDTRPDQAVEIALAGGEVWRPSDAAAPSGKDMTLADALAYSRNTITAALMQEVGVNKVVQLARALGVRQSPLAPVPALALGSSPVTLKEMVSAYGTLANGGRYQEPMWVTRIENRDGELLAEFAPAAPEQALDGQLSYTLVDMLRGVIDKGTARAIRQQYGIRADVAGKTGTTQGNADGWFILMHPELVVGAWAGFNDGRISLRNDHWGQGARSALPMVGDLTARALRARVIDSRAKFTAPEESRWWSGLGEALRTRWDSWWAPARPETDAAAGTPRKRAAPPPDSAAPAPTPVPEVQTPAERITVVPATGLPMPVEPIEESTPLLPLTAGSVGQPWTGDGQ
ncbi:transglycosylase domain-containing protein [Pantoea sp. 18069]|uniref:penicillin-binding protein 1A n=1 Tax=Pantoea sp. 18069 TaxID=2681415 RepID=UPI00190F97AE|nr:transglycosylase domain-containing protein [Pantoea sp. 18069]